jgi:hypothetical protein
MDSQTTQLSPLAPLTGSERVRRTRERKGKDILLVAIEVLATERDRLIRLGLLHKSRRSDKIAVRDALYLFFEKHLDPPQPWPLGEWNSKGVNNG